MCNLCIWLQLESNPEISMWDITFSKTSRTLYATFSAISESDKWIQGYALSLTQGYYVVLRWKLVLTIDSHFGEIWWKYLLVENVQWRMQFKGRMNMSYWASVFAYNAMSYLTHGVELEITLDQKRIASRDPPRG